MGLPVGNGRYLAQETFMANDKNEKSDDWNYKAQTKRQTCLVNRGHTI